MHEPSKTIWKYQLDVIDRQAVYMPPDAKVLGCGVQNEFPVIWVEINVPAAEPEVRIFSIVTSGEFYGGVDYRHIGTVTISDWYVAHIIEGAVSILGKKDADMLELRTEMKSKTKWATK